VATKTPNNKGSAKKAALSTPTPRLTPTDQRAAK
jgi:hypothetical protein